MSNISAKQVFDSFASGIVDLSPFTLSGMRREVSQDGFRVDATFSLTWGEQSYPFFVETGREATPKTLEGAILEVRHLNQYYPEYYPMIVVPYLSDRAIERLRAEQISGVDLSGNLLVTVPGSWLVQRDGAPNSFPSSRAIKNIYQGKSSLVGRLLLGHPRFDRIGDIQVEIERRGESISIGTVSKILSALEEELIIEKKQGVRLIQPSRLLDQLIRNYQAPTILERRRGKVDSLPEFLKRLRQQAQNEGERIIGRDESLYTIAPTSGTPLQIYLASERRRLPGTEFGSNFQADLLSDVTWTDRFANLEIIETNDTTIFFDPLEQDGFLWCSKLQIYLELMQEGKGREREQATAEQLRDEILEPGMEGQR